MDSPVLRPATATVEEGQEFARLLDTAAEGMYRQMLGRSCPEILGRAFVQPGHDYSYEHVTFAENGGRIVGMVSGYTAEVHRMSDHEIVVAAAGWRRHRMAAYLRVAARLFDFMDAVPDGDYYVQGFAVDKDLRGKGIGSKLLDHAERTAKEHGSARFALDVAAKNKGGRRLYERRGMTAEAESPRWFGLPNTNVIRMVKAL